MGKNTAASRDGFGPVQKMQPPEILSSLKERLEDYYRQYNHIQYADTDPVRFLFDYTCPHDREVAGLVASCLAYGKVEVINKNAGILLKRLGPSPAEYLSCASIHDIRSQVSGFCHRFAGQTHILGLLSAIKGVRKAYGSLHECFVKGMEKNDETVLPGLVRFYSAMMANAAENPGHLLADPEKGSALKRLHLFLRWMVRKDEVDFGDWEGVLPEKLIVPLDVHMHRMGILLGFTARKAGDGKAAFEVTEGFHRIQPEDPVKYDFSLTRLGMEYGKEVKQMICGHSLTK